MITAIDIKVVIKEPIAPASVFFGLILVSFGPFKILPNIKPPISDAAHAINNVNKIIFKCRKLLKYENNIQ